MFSAYTIRKILPRLLIAVIMIQLSWWVVIQAININNDIAHGLEALIYAPFGGVSAFSIENILQTSQGNSGAYAGFFSAVAAGATAGFVFLGPGTAVGVLALAGTAALGILVAIFTLVLRQVVLLFLVVVAPLAIVAWVLPGTEKLWKLWWESFSKLLLMYPLILIMIASGRVFASVAANSGQNQFLIFTMIVLGFFGPLFMIPATLKLAGTAFSTLTAAVNSRNKGVFDRLRGVRDSQAKQNSAYHMDRMNRKATARRADLQNRWQEASSNTNRNAASRFLLARASGMVGGRNIQAAASAMQAKVGKEINDQIATGRDEEIRALTVNKLRSASRLNNGVREYQTLAGKWVTEGAVDAAYKRWGNDRYAQQAALSYEMRKAATDEQVEMVGKNYKNVATAPGGWGMNRGQATGALVGAGFENQNTHLEFKHMDIDGNLNAAAFAEEAYEKKGNYALSQMSAHTIKQLGVAHATAKRAGDTATMQKVESVAETFMSRYGGGAAAGRIANVTDDGQPLTMPDPAALASAAQAQAAGRALSPAEQQAQYLQQQNYQVNSSGSGHVAEAVRQLAVDVGVYRPLDASTETHSATGDGSNPRHN